MPLDEAEDFESGIVYNKSLYLNANIHIRVRMCRRMCKFSMIRRASRSPLARRWCVDRSCGGRSKNVANHPTKAFLLSTGGLERPSKLRVASPSAEVSSFATSVYGVRS